MDDIGDLCSELNERAGELAPDLLPNGRRSGNKWMFSGLEDHGGSESAYVFLSGVKIGKWFDHGNAVAGEDKGDMLDLLQHKRCHGDKSKAIEEAQRILGKEIIRRPGSQLSAEEKRQRAEQARQRQLAREQKDAAEREKKAKNAKRLFLNAKPIKNTPAEGYLKGRGISPVPGRDWSGSLRFHPETYHGPLQTKLPALVGAIYHANGDQIGAHRIFLQENRLKGWVKLQGAPDVPAKLVLGNMWGGFVPIHKGRSGVPMSRMAEGEPVYITEGIEDACVVAMVKPEARVIAAISLANIGAIILPDAAARIVVVADRDDNTKAQDQLERSIAQQQSRGLEVSLVMPPVGVKDVNDWLLAAPRKAGVA